MAIDILSAVGLLLEASPAGACCDRLRGPNVLGRPSEPELDNASEGRVNLLTLSCIVDGRRTWMYLTGDPRSSLHHHRAAGLPRDHKAVCT